MPRLKPKPSISIDDRAGQQEREPQRHARRAMQNSIANAGSITNSPCAKLIMPAACHSSVKPSAASA